MPGPRPDAYLVVPVSVVVPVNLYYCYKSEVGWWVDWSKDLISGTIVSN